MTVSYQYDVASSSTGGFFRLLWRWRGSIWKLLYKELLLFIAIYFAISLTYELLMPNQIKWYYETVVVLCSAFVEIMPLSFILGFYVTFTATRWWQQYTAIPWPDKLMNIIALYVPGSDETSRILRRTLMRYLNLTLVLVLRSISIPVKRRFPTKDHLIEAGFMTKPELEMYSSVPSHEFNTFWIPCTWFVNLLREAKSECRITDSGGLKLIMEEFNDFRSKCGLLWSYDWVSIPLVYTQVVTLSTHAFFLASLFGRQHISSNSSVDRRLLNDHLYGEHYFPIFTLLQFILYMGLLKLGEQLINPFGDDDEDFELNWIIDRHLKVSYLGVDILNADPPPLMKDNYFDETDIKLPYTQAAVAHKVKTYRGSVAAFHVPTDKHGLVIPEFEDEDDNQSDDDNASTVQSNANLTRSSVWNVFKRTKQSDSGSTQTVDSEAMVENCPLWVGSQDSMDTQQTDVTTLTKDGGYSSDRSSQGIRGKNEDSKRNEFIINIQSKSANSGVESVGADNTARQSTSSVDTPLFYGELSAYISESNRKDSTSYTSSISSVNTSTTSAPKASKSPKQLTPTPANSSSSNVKRSLSTNTPKKIKFPSKSMIKGNRTVDPKLKIKPFRSKVTFSEDTKYDDGKKFQSIDLLPKIRVRRDSSTESNESPQIFDPNDRRIEAALRRQSLDPSKIILPEAEPLKEDDKWLHHQSLPNIQEGQEDEAIVDILDPVSPSLARKASVRRHTSDRTTERRKSFKRQMRSEEPVIDDKQPQSETEGTDCQISQTNDKPDDKTNEIGIDGTTKLKAKVKPRQSSTESDTGSFHTASSFLMQISEDGEEGVDTLQASISSIDSFKSAIDASRESMNQSKPFNHRDQRDIVINPNVGQSNVALPAITITQSTPSINSSSSDDNTCKRGFHRKSFTETEVKSPDVSQVKNKIRLPISKKKLAKSDVKTTSEKR